jgi:HSP20 family molecular chaperone IbpA
MFSLMLRDPFFSALDKLETAKVSNEKDDLTYFFEVPGMTKEDLRIEVENRILSVEGTFSKGNYQRSISERIYLPRGIELDSASAIVSNGLLTISFKKTPEASKKVISIV